MQPISEAPVGYPSVIRGAGVCGRGRRRPARDTGLAPGSAHNRPLASQAVSPTAPNTMTSNGVMQHIAARTAPIAPVVMRVRSRMAGSTPGRGKIPASVVAKVPDRDLIIGQDDRHFYASVTFLAQFERRSSPPACTQQSLGHC